jgi:hypothetical protein
MIPTRRDWRGAYIHPAAISVEAHEFFGWKVHRHCMPVGSKLITQATGPILRPACPNLTLYVRGRASVTDSEGNALTDRVPGMFSAERPDHPAGTFTVTAAEPVEFWCFNWHANRGALPSASALRVNDGASFQGQPGQRVILCKGQLGDHQEASAFWCDGSAMTAVGQVYGFLVGGDRV